MQHPYELFIGGISEDDKLVMPGQVLYSENLDLTGNSDFITLAPKPSSYFTMTSDIACMYVLQRTFQDSLVVGGDNKEIFYNGVQVYTANRDVKAFWSNSVNLLWVDASEDVYYIPLSDINSTDWTGFVLPGVANLVNASGDVSVVERESTSYISFGINIYEINNADGLLVNTYSFCYAEIVGMTIIAGQIKVFQEDGRVFLWDGVSASYSQQFKLSTRVELVNQSANQEYVIGGGALYTLNGATLDKIASAFNSDKMESAKIGIRKWIPNSLGFSKGMTYVGGDDVIDLSDSLSTYQFGNNTPILTYGVKKGGFPLALNNWITQSSGGSGYRNIFGMIMRSTYDDFLYVAYENWAGVIGVDSINLDTQNNTTSDQPGLLVLPKFDGGNKKLMKNLKRLKVRADFGNDNGKFVFFEVKAGGVLSPLNTDIAKSTLQNHTGDDIYELVVNKNFLDITIAVVFDQDNDYLKNDAIKLYSITLDYDKAGR